MDGMVRTVTVFGDSLVLLPGSALLSVYLCRTVSNGAAAIWMRTLIGCLSTVAAAKILGYALAERADAVAGTAGTPAVSISGHAAFAALFFTSVCIIAASGLDHRGRVALGAAAAGIVVAVAASRLLLAAHTPLEAGLGVGTGLAFAMVFSRSYARHPRSTAGSTGFWLGLLTAVCAGRLIAAMQDTNLESVFRAIAAVLVGRS